MRADSKTGVDSGDRASAAGALLAPAAHWQAGFAFSERLFGWKTDMAIPMGDDRGPTSFSLSYFAVEDIDAALARATDGGASLVMGPVGTPGGMRVVRATDSRSPYFAMVRGPQQA